MKKIFSIILCGAILFSNISTVFAEEILDAEVQTDFAEEVSDAEVQAEEILDTEIQTDVFEETQEQESLKFTPKQADATSALRALGFVSEDYTEEIILESGDITRAKFAEFVSAIFSHITISDSLYFHDVPRTHYAFTSISSLVESGVLTVNEEKTFRPDEYITPGEASKILVYLLGYNQVCESSPDPMSMVKRVASDMKLFSGVSSASDKLSFADMLLLVYNSLTVVLPDIYPIPNDNNDTYLSKHYDTYLAKGRVVGVGGTGIYGDAIPQGKAKIDNELLNVGNVDLLPYLGKTVKYLYLGNDDKKVIWAKDLGMENEIVIQRENSPEYLPESNTIRYFVNDREKTAKLSSFVNIIYNGVHLNTDASELLNDNLSYVRLISEGSKEYELCIVESYENGYVSSNDLMKKEIYTRYYDTEFDEYRYSVVDLSAYEYVEIILPDGTMGEQKDIPANSIISIYKSADEASKIRIVCSVSRETGVIEDYIDDDVLQKCIINGTEYSVYKEDLRFEYTIGGNVELKLDALGYIADIDVLTGSAKFAYLVKTSISTEDPVSDRLELKVFDVSSGEMKRILCATRLRIDGRFYKDPELAEEAFVFTHFGNVPQFIAYSMNEEGYVNMIDTPTVQRNDTILTKDDMLIITSDFENLIYNSRTNTFGPKIRVGSGTTFLSVPSLPTSNSQEEEFGVGSVSYFSNETYYNVSTYRYGMEERKEVTDILLCDSCRFYSEYWVSTRFLVDKIKLGMNEEYDVVHKISGYHGNVYKTLFCSEEVSKAITSGTKQIAKGDVISITNETGKIDDFTVQYGPSAIKRPTSTFTMSGARQTCFYPVDVVGTTVYGGINSKDTFEEIFTPAGTTIFVYNSQEDELYQGSLADLHTYKVYRDRCSTVFYYSVSGEGRNFIIYN